MRGQDSQGDAPPADHAVEAAAAFGTDERRMHVRAYNYWVSLLAGRAFPAVTDLDPASLDDFGPNSVLLDFTGGPENPAIRWLGRALREEGRIGAHVRTISDVPGRSLLSRLTDHYLQIIANRAPVGFEAEFVNVRGNEALYRGILMPFSSNGQAIDFIYGVINWKELADPRLAADIVAAADRAMAAVRADASAHAGAAVWADGPSRSFASAGETPQADPVELAALGDPGDAGPSPADALAQARDCADAVASSELRSRAALYRAIAHAYAFARAAEAEPDAYAELLADAGVAADEPMMRAAALVFGGRGEDARLEDYAAALSHAARHEVAPEAMISFLDSFRGGLKGVVAAEREAQRRDEAASLRDPGAVLRARAPVATVALAVEEEFVLLLARRTGPGEVAILGVADDSALLDRALRRAAHD